jgi:hypothetical protein
MNGRRVVRDVFIKREIDDGREWLPVFFANSMINCRARLDSLQGRMQCLGYQNSSIRTCSIRVYVYIYIYIYIYIYTFFINGGLELTL